MLIIRRSAIGLFVIGFLLFSAACGNTEAAQEEPSASSSEPTGETAAATEETTAAAEETTIATEEEQEHGTHAYALAMEPAGHWHVGHAKTVQFSITDAETGELVHDQQDLQVQIVRAGSDRVTTRSVDAGDITFLGDGVYTLEYTPSSFSPYAFSARVEDDGQVFASEPWIVEIAKAGEEGIRVDANGTTNVYQIRYFWDPGHVHAGSEDPATLSFEVMRATQEGDAINWDQPWSNTFDHVINGDHVEVTLTSTDGNMSEELHAIYKGKGIYEVERGFATEEMGHDGMDYEVMFHFTDPYNGAEVSNEEAFHLHVASPH